MREDLHVDVGAKIRLGRLERGWTQAQLGRAIGYSQNAVAGWENGRRACRLEVLEAIARALEVPLAQLLPVRTRESSPDYGGDRLELLVNRLEDAIGRLEEFLGQVERSGDRREPHL